MPSRSDKRRAQDIDRYWQRVARGLCSICASPKPDSQYACDECKSRREARRRGRRLSGGLRRRLAREARDAVRQQ
jgi:hypothetical protein